MVSVVLPQRLQVCLCLSFERIVTSDSDLFLPVVKKTVAALCVLKCISSPSLTFRDDGHSFSAIGHHDSVIYTKQTTITVLDVILSSNVCLLLPFEPRPLVTRFLPATKRRSLLGHWSQSQMYVFSKSYLSS